MINQETIQRIREAARIEEVVGEFVSLKKHGASYIACCPFHDEKTPSFHVNPARGIFKCFGCGEGGDSVGFLMKHEHYTYPEALRYLAKKYNIAIEEEQQNDDERQRQSERDALFHLTEFAQKYFADVLFNDEMGSAVGLSYFHGRGMSDDIVRRFGLGFCKDQWSDFLDHARKNGYSDAVLEKTGLAVFREDGKAYDRFRGRVMFPIYSISGRVLGFSGRVLSSEAKTAKYVNSPESDIYTKGNSLYGLYQARQAISRKDKCYLVEGNVDVVSMHQSGVENTVASCGTALTVNQIRLIKRYTSNVTVLYDGDAAGIKATLKAVNLLFGEGMRVRMVLFPDGDDPDSYAQKYGSTQLQQYLADHEENFLLYRMRLVGDEIKRDPIRKAELEGEIVRTIALVTDPLERSEYISRCASLFSVAEQTLTTLVARAMLNGQSSEPQPSQQSSGGEQSATDVPAQPAESTGLPPEQGATVINSTAKAQEQKLISLLVCHGAERIAQGNVAKIIVDDISADGLSFDDPLMQRVFDLYSNALRDGSPLPDANYFASTDDVAVRQLALGMIMDDDRSLSPSWSKKNIYIPSHESKLPQDITESLLSFKQKRLQQRMNDVDLRMKGCTDYDEMQMLLAEKQELVRLNIKIGTALRRVIT